MWDTETDVDIFVFGSNEAGIHGAGAAKTALEKYGAEWGQGYGLQGLAPIARSFGIPTKDKNLKPLPLWKIEDYVKRFISEARANPQRNFFVTRIGCGYAGYKDKEIAPMFYGAPENCQLPSAWIEILNQAVLFM